MAESLSLSDAVARALATGPDLLIARLEADRAKNLLSETRSSYLPSLSLSSSAGYSNRQDDTLRAVDSNGTERKYGLASLGNERGWVNVFLRQLVLDMRTWRNIQKSELEAEVAETAAREQREAIAFAIFERYANVLRIERLIALDGERLQHAEWLDQQARVLLDGGRSLPAEREQVALHLAEVRMESLLQQEALAEARRGLWLVIGMSESEGEGVELAGETIPSPESGPVESDLAQHEVLEATPEVKILGLRRQVRELDVSAARAGRYPTLALEMGYRHFGTKRFDNFEDELLVAVDFEIPLFDGFRAWHDIEGSSKEAEVARLRYRTLLEQKRSRLRELTGRLEATRQRPELANRRSAAARERLRLADVSLQAGRGTLDQALAARMTLGRDATAAIDAEFDRVVLWATLRREAGLLSDAILADPVASAAADSAD